MSPTTPPVRPSDQGGAGPTVWTKLARCRWGRLWLRHQLWGRVTLLPGNLLSAHLLLVSRCWFLLDSRSQDFSTCSLLAASLFVCGDVLRIALVLMKYNCCLFRQLVRSFRSSVSYSVMPIGHPYNPHFIQESFAKKIKSFFHSLLDDLLSQSSSPAW